MCRAFILNSSKSQARASRYIPKHRSSIHVSQIVKLFLPYKIIIFSQTTVRCPDWRPVRILVWLPCSPCNINTHPSATHTKINKQPTIPSCPRVFSRKSISTVPITHFIEQKTKIPPKKTQISSFPHPHPRSAYIYIQPCPKPYLLLLRPDAEDCRPAVIGGQRQGGLVGDEPELALPEVVLEPGRAAVAAAVAREPERGRPRAASAPAVIAHGPAAAGPASLLRLLARLVRRLLLHLLACYGGIRAAAARLSIALVTFFLFFFFCFEGLFYFWFCRRSQLLW